jgi:hypothetical protein
LYKKSNCPSIFNSMTNEESANVLEILLVQDVLPRFPMAEC